VGEAEMNLFVKYIHDYNKTHRPPGARARARARAARLRSPRAPHAAHLVRASVVRCAGASGRARKAARDAREDILPPSLAPSAAGPQVLNPSVAVRGGKQPQARKKGAHETAKPAAKRARQATAAAGSGSAAGASRPSGTQSNA
jgi:hypothetical protein